MRSPLVTDATNAKFRYTRDASEWLFLNAIFVVSCTFSRLPDSVISPGGACGIEAFGTRLVVAVSAAFEARNTTQTHTHTDTQIQTHTGRHTQTHIQADTHKHTDTQKQTQTPTHRDTEHVCTTAHETTNMMTCTPRRYCDSCVCDFFANGRTQPCSPVTGHGSIFYRLYGTAVARARGHCVWGDVFRVPNVAVAPMGSNLSTCRMYTRFRATIA